MNAIEALIAVRAAGGSVVANGTALTVHVPADLPGPVWDALAAHKSILLDLLAPRVSHAELSALEEREAIQAEADAPADAIEFAPLPRSARRCRLVRDAQWRAPNLGIVTFTAGIEGTVVDDLGEIVDPLERTNVDWIRSVDRAAGRSTIVVSIDGRARVLDSTAVLILDEGAPAP